MRRIFWVFVLLFAFTSFENLATINSICPASGIRGVAGEDHPKGLILTYFDRYNLWVYDIAQNTRYPLPSTSPCGTNCHLSQNADWISYFDTTENTFNKMRLDGTERTQLASNASEVSWWSEDTILVWTPEHEVYLRQEESAERQELDAEGVISIQPGGTWAVYLEQTENDFTRTLINLEDRQNSQLPLSIANRYYSTSAWSPDGTWLAYTSSIDQPDGTISTEIFAIRPGDAYPIQWTRLSNDYGAVRINGHSPGELSWSPDGTKIAFWVIPMIGPNPVLDGGEATLHVFDLQTGFINSYCGFTTTDHTPNPPRLMWSPNSTHIALGGQIPDDERGYALLTVDVTTGIWTELSIGLYPALGSPDVVAWGVLP